MRRILLVRSSLALVSLAVAGGAASSGCSSSPSRSDGSDRSGASGGSDIGVAHQEMTTDPEIICEAHFKASWATSLPSVGFASNAAAQLIDQAVLSELSKPGMQHPQYAGGNWPAFSVSVTHGSHLVFAKTYGFADMQSPQVAHPDNLFRIASDSKQITGATILKLIHDGQTVDGVTPLTLATQIFPVLTSGPNAILPPLGKVLNPALQTITVEQVLHHTGGWALNIGDPVWYAYQPSPVFPVTLDAPVSATMPLLPTLTPPGQSYSYSNFGYNLLAAFIEKITGQDYETVVKTRVMNPLGVAHAQVGHSLKPDIADNEVHYYAAPGSGPVNVSLFPADVAAPISGEENIPYGTWSLEAGRGAGGWISSTMDTLRFQLGVDGRGPTQVYPGIVTDITSAQNQPSKQSICMPTAQCNGQQTNIACNAGSTFCLVPVNPSMSRYNAGWGVNYWGPPYNGWDMSHGGGVNGGGAFTEAIPDVTDPASPIAALVGYGWADAINSSQNQAGLSGAQLYTNQTIRDAIIAAVQANGSLRDPAWSTDTSFFDQYGGWYYQGFTAAIWWDAASVNTILDDALVNGCPVPGGRRGARYASCYASRIESRRIGGTIYYRFQLVPLHTKDQTQRTVNASCTTYAATKASAEAAGYRQVNLQYHYDGTGRMRFQSVWVQLNH